MYDAEAEVAPTFEEPTSERRLATVRRIAELLPIEGADRIELAIIDGWQVITQKGLYQPGDLVIYLEIDSWVPNAVAPFLTKEGKTPREYKGVAGERLRSMKMRGQLSQGLLLNVSALNIDHLTNIGFIGVREDDDCTARLGILKWEKEIPANLRGTAKGYFPSELRKTDQERVQNAKRILKENDCWEITTKLDGSSMTCFIDENDEFSVCSRNLQLVETEGNAFWVQARKDDLETKLRDMCIDHGGRLALQGELIGPGIQGNQENLTEAEFHLFDIWDIDNGEYLLPERRWDLSADNGVNQVPVLGVLQETPSIEQALYMADGTSLTPLVQREGIVFKSMTRPGVSFKAVSNAWLLKKGE